MEGEGSRRSAALASHESSYIQELEPNGYGKPGPRRAGQWRPYNAYRGGTRIATGPWEWSVGGPSGTSRGQWNRVRSNGDGTALRIVTWYSIRSNEARSRRIDRADSVMTGAGGAGFSPVGWGRSSSMPSAEHTCRGLFRSTDSAWECLFSTIVLDG